MNDYQKLLNACKEYRAKLDELEKENAKLKDELKEEKIHRSLDGWNEAAIINELKRDNAALREALRDADVIAQYSREDGHRQWWDGNCWLNKGEVLVCMDRAAFDAARKEAQP